MESSPRDAATARSRAIWDDMAAGWEAERDAMWEESRQVRDWLLQVLDPRPGHTLLEIAAGTGDTGFAAAARIGPSGRIITSDFAPAMLNAARRRAAEMRISNAEFRVLDAQRLDLETDSVDGVLCRWGYMLMPDPALAMAETRRVLRQGGRLALSVWGRPEANPWAALPAQVLRERGHLPPLDPLAPGIFALADRDRLHSLVTGAGFTSIRMEEVPTRRRFASADAYWAFLTGAAGAIAPVILALPPAAQAAVRSDLLTLAAPFARDGEYDFPGLCLNAAAV